MITDAPPAIQSKLDRLHAQEIADYINRNSERYSMNGRRITLTTICKRFGIKQAAALRIIENNPDLLLLSEYAFKPVSREAEEKQDWGAMLKAAFMPQHWPDAPVGKRIVLAVTEPAQRTK